MTEGWFDTPVYHAKIANPSFDIIQKDFDSVVADWHSKGIFKNKAEWDATTFFSDPTFTENFLADYRVNSFISELDIHIKTYLTQIGFPFLSVAYDIRSSWMTLNKKGCYGHVHSHGAADMSGVYYYKTSGKDGNIFFETPNKLMTASYCFNHIANRVNITPAEGLLVLFPGWLEHGTQTNTTDDDRMSVSFNLHFKK